LRILDQSISCQSHACREYITAISSQTYTCTNFIVNFAQGMFCDNRNWGSGGLGCRGSVPGDQSAISRFTRWGTL
jgi:hypothetical protein